MSKRLGIDVALALSVASTTCVARQGDDVARAGEDGTFEARYPSAKVHALRILAAHADVKVRGSDGAQAEVVAAGRGDCEVQSALRQGELEVRVRSKHLRGCAPMTLSVEVPHDVTLDVKSGSGDVDIADVAGTLSLRTGSGTARVRGTIAQLRAEAGSGDVHVEGLTGSAVVVAGSGEVRLAYTTLPEGSLQLQQGSGDSLVELPHGPVSTHLRLGSGRVDSQLGHDPRATFAVRGQLGSGNLRIRGRL